MEEYVGKRNQFQNKQNMEAYFQTHDVKYVAEDAIFRNMVTGEEYKGREQIGGMLHYIYQVAFDAKAEQTNTYYKR